MSTISEVAARATTNVIGLEAALADFVKTLALSQSWIQRDWPISTNNPARALLLGAKVALLEAGTAWGIGANRGAASSLRVYMENIFAWLYYKDHPVEFHMVEIGRGDLLLPKASQAYLKLIDGGFDKANAELSKNSVRGREHEYYYTVVSNFVHAHPGFTRIADKIHELAISSPRDSNFLKICQHTDEFISDNYAIHYRGSWDDYPDVVKENIKSRLKDKLKDFLSIS